MSNRQQKQTTKRPARDDEEQSRLFLKKAHEIGADEKKSRADELIGQLAMKPPEPRLKKQDQ